MKPPTILPMCSSLLDVTNVSRFIAIPPERTFLSAEKSESVPVICMDVTGREGSGPESGEPQPVVWYQSVARLPISTTWVLTARVRVEEGEAGLWVRFLKADGSGIPGGGEGILPVSKVDGEWRQMEYPFSLPSGTASVEVGGAVASGSRALFTDFRMESGQEYQARLRREMVETMIEGGTLSKGKIQDAFLRVPRHLFLPGRPLSEVYRDNAITTRFRREGRKALALSSSSQPSAMSIMLENLKLQPGHRVLEIGSGTGYNAALMADIVGARNVFTIDLEEAIVREARENLSTAGYTGVTLMQGDGWNGRPEDAPYDRIIVTAGSSDIAPAWVDQLKEEGILIVPLALPSVQLTLTFQKVGDHLVAETINYGSFMHLRGCHYHGKSRKCDDLAVHYGDQFTEAMLTVVNEILDGPAEGLEIPPAHEGSLSSHMDFKYFLAFHDPMILTFSHPRLRDFGIHEGSNVMALYDPQAGQLGIFLLNLAFGGTEIGGKMKALVERWKAMGMPGLDRLDIEAYSRSIHPTLDSVPRHAGDFLMEKEWNRYVIRYRET